SSSPSDLSSLDWRSAWASRFSTVSRSARASSSSTTRRCSSGSDGPVMSSSSNARSTNTMASTSRMLARNLLPRPSPLDAPSTSPPMSTTWTAACTMLRDFDISANRSSRSSGTLATPMLGSLVANGYGAASAPPPVSALYNDDFPALGSPTSPNRSMRPASLPTARRPPPCRPHRPVVGGDKAAGCGSATCQDRAVTSDDRAIRVFISSTFRDMQLERDELVKRGFPRVRKLCARRGVSWSEVDLRWGVTDEQKAEGAVLPICLAEIDRTRPYFIGLLGQRYGWVPDEIPSQLAEQLGWLTDDASRSVTELEIVHGVLNDPEAAGHAFFYLRDPAWVESLPAEERAVFVEESPVGARRLEELRERVRASGHPAV